ncbi:2-oxo-4-hydroxy-4-carboxy-5-ureidoimidazoline decarboxylase [Streptomyces fulvorobeus]|uniref:2-oxo-4-hydroxy-4-carboxy-5-ureidoimidazoline decarboxylase n=1 Tax=Streptomyces fulvorobeus TaxID=284028 RepID=UPI0015652426|nr:2-oxo-4-hydroxy-4-carboxy-5-ureidoimidazoline decarboxylase [Streptomyces fulvorobeus]
MPRRPRQAGRAAPPVRSRGPAPAPAPAGDHAAGLARFNTAPRPEAEAALLECCGSHRWALRLAAHRPYPDLDALLAASDEASYDLSPTDIAEALAGETAPCLHHDAPRAAHLALRAAHAAYESRFGHVFVISLDAHRPSQQVDQVLAGIRARLAHDPDEERAVTADEMRRLARERIIELVADAGPAKGPYPGVPFGML